MLWGSYAQRKGRHRRPAAQPDPQGAAPLAPPVYRGFFGCRHFSQANEYLRSIGRTPIEW